MDNIDEKEILEAANPFTKQLWYKGNVSVKVLENDIVIKEYKNHNSGAKTIFDFFAYCLQGNYYAAEDCRPCQIILFGEDANHTGIYSTENRMSTAMYYDRAEIKPKDTGYVTTYHFRLPFIYLKSGNVKYLALYPKNIQNTTSELDERRCASFTLSNAIEVPATAGNYTIIVDWELSCTNAGSSSTN